MKDSDVLIVGGGAAGLTVAALLRRTPPSLRNDEARALGLKGTPGISIRRPLSGERAGKAVAGLAWSQPDRPQRCAI